MPLSQAKRSPAPTSHVEAGRRIGRKSSKQDALLLATRYWARGQKLEMAALAAELGVTRVTLFRWAGNRDELLAEVLWSQWDLLWQAALTSEKGAGAKYVAAVCKRVMSGILQSHGMRTFLADDPEYALRILTSKRSPVQQRVIENVRTLILDQSARGHIDLPIEAGALAYAMVRIVESFIYSDQIAGLQPNTDIPAQILSLVLRPDQKKKLKS